MRPKLRRYLRSMRPIAWPTTAGRALLKDTPHYALTVALLLLLAHRPTHKLLERIAALPPVMFVARIFGTAVSAPIALAAMAVGVRRGPCVLPRPRALLQPRALDPRILGAAAALSAFASNEGVRRSLRFNAAVMPAFVEYRYWQWRNRPAPLAERARRYEWLHEKHCELPLRVAVGLGGFYVKVGQVMSSFGEAIVPKQYVRTLSVLQDDSPNRRPAAYVRRLVESELGAPIPTLFSHFDDEPLGAASIGQAHAATLRGSGLAVVVKIQFPEARRFFRIDMRTLKNFCRLAAPSNVAIMEEIERQFITEFDYRLEARLLRQAARNLMPHFGERVVVPLPIDAQHPANPLANGRSMCTSLVLTMERLHGVSLLATQRRQLTELAERRNTTAEALRAELQRRFASGELHGKLGPPSWLVQVLHAIDRLWFAAHNAARRLSSWAAGTEYRRREGRAPRLDPSRVIRTLFDVHGHQLLHDGFFNGDPHPGNLLLCHDGRLGLIDWGQVKTLDVSERVRLARLLVALADRDHQLSAELWAACGFETTRGIPWAIDRWATWRFARNTPDVTAGLGGPLRFEDTLSKIDGITTEPQQYVMAYRLAALLRGNAMSLGDLTVDSAVQWRPHAVRLLKRCGEEVPRTCRGRPAETNGYDPRARPSWLPAEG